MNQFELLYIIPAKLEGAEQKAVKERVDKIITDNKGVIKDHNAWLTRKLSYPIKHIRQGVFMLAHFNLDGDNNQKIKKEMEIDEDILRTSLFKITESRKPAAAPRRAEKILPQSAQKQPVAEEVSATAEAEPEVKEKISLEELDKRLEELLGEDSQV
jgi:small subunit ribosomal protein S6